ncbi:hypothetical protein [Paracoccus sp. ME4]|uniref:hypothetical protein n=1 Tax=Paracoccus sp. ME4 TaxID=3138066 RepID=UPI00398A9018
MSNIDGQTLNPNRCLDCMTPAALQSLAIIASDRHSIHDLSAIGVCGKTGCTEEVWDIQHLLIQRWTAIRETGRPPETYEALRFNAHGIGGAGSEVPESASLAGAA